MKKLWKKRKIKENVQRKNSTAKESMSKGKDGEGERKITAKDLETKRIMKKWGEK